MKKLSIKNIVTIFAGVIFLAWVAGSVLLFLDEREGIQNLPKSHVPTEDISSVKGNGTSTTTAQKIPSTTLSISPTETRSRTMPTAVEVQSIPQVYTSNTTSTVSENLIVVRLTVGSSTKVFSLPQKSSVEDLMLVARDAGFLFFNGKTYSSIGLFIESINGIENNMSNGDRYWIYKVNGKKATMGVSKYILNSHDVVEWNYEEYQI